VTWVERCDVCLQLHLALIPQCRGELHIHSLAFRLGSAANSLLPDPVADASATTIAGFVTLEVQGPRLNGTKAERTGLFYAPDRRLSPLVTDQLPKLEVGGFSGCFAVCSCNSRLCDTYMCIW